MPDAETFTLILPGGRLPARHVTLPDGVPGIEIEGVALEHVRDGDLHGLSGNSDVQRRMLDDLRRRYRITSEAPVLNFELE